MSVVLQTLTQGQTGHHLDQVTSQATIPKAPLRSPSSHPPILPQQPLICSLSLQECPTEGIMYSAASWDWLTSLSTMPLGFPSMAEEYPIE